MKIIKVGNLESKTYNEICYKCNSELQYEQKDIQSDRDGKYIVCPVCKAYIATNKTKIDQHG